MSDPSSHTETSQVGSIDEHVVAPQQDKGNSTREQMFGADIPRPFYLDPWGNSRNISDEIHQSKQYKDLVTKLQNGQYLDDERQQKMNDVENIINGTLRGEVIQDYQFNFLGSSDIPLLRIKLAKMYLSNPEFVIQLVHKTIIGGHGGSSLSLPGVLGAGLRPRGFLADNPTIVSGERSGYSALGGESGVSIAVLSDDETLSRYAVAQGREAFTREVIEERLLILRGKLNADKPTMLAEDIAEQIANLEQARDVLEESDRYSPIEISIMQQNFPIIYLISADYAQDTTINPKGYLNLFPGRGMIWSELLLEGGADVNRIPIILVPEEKIALVQQLIIEKGLEKQIKIFPISCLVQPEIAA